MTETTTGRARGSCVARIAGFAWSAAFALTLAAIHPARAAEWSDEKAAKADTLVTQLLGLIDRQESALSKASLVYGIATRQGLIAAKGYREAREGVPATVHTVYHVGSLAKQFTAAGVLDLIARGAALRDGTPVSLDLELSRVFSGVEHWPGRDADPGKQPVTLRSLLTMTSNLPNFTRLPPPSANPWGRISAPELLSEIKRFNPTGWPNTFEYSNTSYFLLAEVMEEAVLPGEAGPKSHHAYLRDTIFPRARLRETGFVDDPALGTMTAVAIHRRTPVFDQPDWLKGSADITSSVADIAAWNAALMEGRILPDGMRARMFAEGARVTPDIYYGMGWFIEHRPEADVFSHSGLVPGFTSYNIIAVEPTTAAWMSVTVLVNTDGVEGIDTFARELLRIAKE